jgi:HAD superfamily hydrolase (TIGR01490 family)
MRKNCLLLDFDGTLIRRDSTLPLLKALLVVRPWKVLQVIRFAFVVKTGSDPQRIQQAKNRCIGALVEGLSEVDLHKALHAFEQEVHTLLRPGMRQLVADRREASHVIIASASPAFALRNIAKSLGTHLVATEFETVDGVYTGNLLSVCCYGANKVPAILKLIDSLDQAGDIESAWSDCLSDLPMMKLARHRYWIGAPHRLEKIRSTDPDAHFIAEN